MADEPLAQPPLPFEPALDLVSPANDHGPEREVSLDAFTHILIDEFGRRTAALSESAPRPRV